MKNKIEKLNQMIDNACAVRCAIDDLVEDINCERVDGDIGESVADRTRADEAINLLKSCREATPGQNKKVEAATKAAMKVIRQLSDKYEVYI